MKNMFKIMAEGNPTELEMSRDVLDMALRLAEFTDKNYERADFFTVGRTRHSDFKNFLQTLQETNNRLQGDDDTISIHLDKEHFRIFQNVFTVARMFFDDMPEFDEQTYDEIYDMAEIIDPIEPYRG